MMDKSGKNLFFLGKGGVGKTTIAASLATALAESGRKVVLFSMDPAHNLFDIFQIKSSQKTVKLENNFIIEEIDIDFWIKVYLKSIEEKIEKSYQYLTSLSLEKHIGAIRYSPGLEEYALQFAYKEVIKKYDGYAYRLFDMPPTALALRFFNLPKLTIIWLEQLIELRKKILEKKKIVREVYQKKSKGSDDNVLNQLFDMLIVNQRLIENFQNFNESGIYIVLNEDQLSLGETSDIYDLISKNGFYINGFLVNKCQECVNGSEIAIKFDNFPTYFFPLVTDLPIGIAGIKKFLRNPMLERFIDSFNNSTRE